MKLEQAIHAELLALRQELKKVADRLDQVGLQDSLELLTRTKAAKRLGMSTSTLARRIRDGSILCVEDGRIPSSQVRQYAAAVVQPKRHTGGRSRGTSKLASETGRAGRAKLRELMKRS